MQKSLVGAGLSVERWLVADTTLAVVAPLLATAAAAFGVRFEIGGPIALITALLCSPWLARRLPSEWDGAHKTHPVWCGLWLLTAVLAVVRSGGIAWFVADSTHAQSSAFWFDQFYINHNCYTGYWRAAELLRDGAANLYDWANYDGKFGDFPMDAYIQVPQFLILPRLGMALGGDFYQVREVWFAIEGLLTIGAMLVVCHWIGGPLGRRAMLLVPAVWLSSPFMLTLQLGNYQLATIALMLLAMIVVEYRRPMFGGALFSLGAFKLYPGVLGIYLLMNRQWRAAAWAIGFSLLYCVIAYWWFGSVPFERYLNFNAPRLASGDDWIFLLYTDPVVDAGTISVNGINDSVPGLALKLNCLGFEGLNSFTWTNRLAAVWTVVVVVLAVLGALRSRQMSRLEKVASWLAILTMASFRSPFVPDHEGLIAPLWLLSLITAASPLRPRNVAWLALAWIALSAALPFSGTPLEGYPRMLISTISQFVAVGLCFWVLLRRPTGPAADSADLAAGLGARP